jgi:hypothetical protein
MQCDSWLQYHLCHQPLPYLWQVAVLCAHPRVRERCTVTPLIQPLQLELNAVHVILISSHLLHCLPVVILIGLGYAVDAEEAEEAEEEDEVDE